MGSRVRILLGYDCKGVVEASRGIGEQRIGIEETIHFHAIHAVVSLIADSDGRVGGEQQQQDGERRRQDEHPAQRREEEWGSFVATQ